MQSKSFILKSILVIVLLIPVGCATQKARPYIGDKLLDKPGIDLSKVQTLTFPQVKEIIVSESLSFTSLKAKAGITLTSPGINGEFRCKGVVRFQKPGKIRVIGSKLARTVFDMLSDGENYWFYLPKEKVVYKGKCNVTRKTNTDKAELSSRAYIFPDDIATLLEYDSLFEGRHAYMETWPTFWLVHILEQRSEEFVAYGRLSVDRIDNTVNELTMFKPDSFVRVQASFSDYAEINGQPIPKEVQINWPDTRTTLILNLDNIIINETLKPEIFQFKKAERAEIIETN
jgi:outer membrane lipoprotein-sorting protein